MGADVFFQELNRLIAAHPKRPTQAISSLDCEFADYVYHSKNLYNCFDCLKDVNGIYLFDTHLSTSCADCDFSTECELCYDCVDCYKCFNGNFLEYCQSTRDAWYSYNCSNCHDIFGCVSLRNKSFCIFNRHFSEEEYREKVAYLQRLPPQQILQMVEQIKAQHPLTQTHEFQNTNSPFGNYTRFCKNSYMCFDSQNCENAGYVYDATLNMKYCYDVTQCDNIELSYEVLDSTKIFNSEYIIFSNTCADSAYLIDCLDVKNALGCMKLEHKQYCILNRQFTKEAYERIAIPLIQELRAKNYAWGSLKY